MIRNQSGENPAAKKTVSKPMGELWSLCFLDCWRLVVVFFWIVECWRWKMILIYHIDTTPCFFACLQAIGGNYRDNCMHVWLITIAGSSRDLSNFLWAKKHGFYNISHQVVSIHVFIYLNIFRSQVFVKGSFLEKPWILNESQWVGWKNAERWDSFWTFWPCEKFWKFVSL